VPYWAHQLPSAAARLLDKSKAANVIAVIGIARMKCLLDRRPSFHCDCSPKLPAWAKHLQSQTDRCFRDIRPLLTGFRMFNYAACGGVSRAAKGRTVNPANSLVLSTSILKNKRNSTDY